MSEAVRAAGRDKVPTSILSRAVAGVSGRTLVVNLPGSTGGVRDGMQVLGPVLGHAVDQLAAVVITDERSGLAGLTRRRADLGTTPAAAGRADLGGDPGAERAVAAALGGDTAGDRICAPPGRPGRAWAYSRRCCAVFADRPGRVVRCLSASFRQPLVGQLTVSNIVRGAFNSASVGYWVDERVAGRGVMPTALALVVDHCFGPARPAPDRGEYPAGECGQPESGRKARIPRRGRAGADAGN